MTLLPRTTCRPSKMPLSCKMMSMRLAELADFFFRRLQYVFLCFQVFAYWRDPEVKLKDISTGTRWVHRGRSLLFLEPFPALELLERNDVSVFLTKSTSVTSVTSLLSTLFGLDFSLGANLADRLWRIGDSEILGSSRP